MYCPTHFMLADCFNKTLSVSLFHQFRDIIMGRFSSYTLLKDIASYSNKERVENKIPGNRSHKEIIEKSDSRGRAKDSSKRKREISTYP